MSLTVKNIEKSSVTTASDKTVDVLNGIVNGTLPITFRYSNNDNDIAIYNTAGTQLAAITNVYTNYVSTIDTVKFDNGLIVYLSYATGGIIRFQSSTIIVKFSDTEAYISTSLGDFATTSGNKLWAYSVSNPDNYVAFAPLISVSSNFATGLTADGVYMQSGIDSSLWTKNGLVVNGHTFYGAQELCICAD